MANRSVKTKNANGNLNWLLIGVLFVAFVIIGAGVGFVLNGYSGDLAPVVKDADTTIVTSRDSDNNQASEVAKAYVDLSVVPSEEDDKVQSNETTEVSPKPDKKVKPRSEPEPHVEDDSPSSGSVNLVLGTYTGPVKNGKADGVGGTIEVTCPYTIDLKKAEDETLEVKPGDSIVNVKMSENRLIMGTLIRKDGTSQFFYIGV